MFLREKNNEILEWKPDITQSIKKTNPARFLYYSENNILLDLKT